MVERQNHCQNDGTELSGDYCHTCGQSADEPRRAVIGLVQDVFVDTLAIDGKLARTIALLLWRPGVLAKRYLDGKRVRYSPPFRLYLFASVFFFLAAFWMSDFDKIPAPSPAETDIETLLDPPGAGGDVDSAEEPTEAVSFAEKTWGDVNYSGPEWAEPHLERMFLAAQRAATDPRLFIAESRQNLPRTMLLAPVMYALILLVLYIYRRKFYIYDHFVISLYMHAALYAYLLLAMLLATIPVVGGWLAAIPLIWGWLQPAVVLRQAYGSGRISMVIKWAISMLIYVIGVALIVTLGLTYSLYQS